MSIRRLFGEGIGKLKEEVKKRVSGAGPGKDDKPVDPDVQARMDEMRKMFEGMSGVVASDRERAKDARSAEKHGKDLNDAPAADKPRRSKSEEVRDRVLRGSDPIDYDNDWFKIADSDCKMDIFLDVDRSRFDDVMYKIAVNDLLKSCFGWDSTVKRKEEFVRYLFVHDRDLLLPKLNFIRGLSHDFAMEWLRSGSDTALYSENIDRAKDGLPPVDSVLSDNSAFYSCMRIAKIDPSGVGMFSFSGLKEEFLDELIERKKPYMVAAVPGSLKYFDEKEREGVVAKYLQYCFLMISNPEIIKLKDYALKFRDPVMVRSANVLSMSDIDKIAPYLGKVPAQLPSEFRRAGYIDFAEGLEKALEQYRAQSGTKE